MKVVRYVDRRAEAAEFGSEGAIEMQQVAALQKLGLLKPVHGLFEREEGQDMIEYALLAALISIVAIAVILLVGPYLDNLFRDVINAVNEA
jgi:pilus assembly protein Flp/PilA